MAMNAADQEAFSLAFQAPTALYRTLEQRPPLFLPRTLSYRQSRLKRHRRTRRWSGSRRALVTSAPPNERFVRFELLGCDGLPAGSVLCVVILEEVEVKGRKWYRPTSEPNVSVLL